MTPTSSSTPPRVLMVGWAGANWQGLRPLLDAGSMPALQTRLSAGVHGNLAPVKPHVSPMLWTSLATGSRADKHGICSFFEVVEGSAGLVRVAAAQVRCPTVWAALSAAGENSVVVNWPASAGSDGERVVVASDEYFRRAHAEVNKRAAPQGLSARLVERLGECREAAGAAAGERFDRVLDAFCHVHQVACQLVRERPWRLAAVGYPGAEELVESAASQRAASAIRRAGWKLLDAMLDELDREAGEGVDLIVASPCGDGESSAPLSQMGVLVAAGPRVKSGQQVYGATILDIEPTVRRLLGLSSDPASDGRVLASMLRAERRARRSPYELCEAVPAADVHRESASPWVRFDATPEVVPASEGDCAVVRWNQRLNLALALHDSNRIVDAIASWQSLWDERPKEISIGLKLADCLLRDRRLEECGRVIERLPDVACQLVEVQLLRARLAHARRDRAEAVALASLVSARCDPAHSILDQAARLLMECGQLDAAEAAYQRAVELNGRDASAHVGLARVWWERDQSERTAAEARKALAVAPAYSEARFLLAQALHRMGREQDAIPEFEQCLQDQWRTSDAHSHLASLYASRDAARAVRHRELAGV